MDFVSPAPSNLSHKAIRKLACVLRGHVNYQNRTSLDQIVRRQGGRIEYIGLTALANAATPQIEIRSPADFTIYVGAHISPDGVRYRVAQALGFLVVNYKWAKFKGWAPVPMRVNRVDPGPALRDAAVFACEFLMPTEELHRVAKEMAGNLLLISAHFGVPQFYVDLHLKLAEATLSAENDIGRN